MNFPELEELLIPLAPKITVWQPFEASEDLDLVFNADFSPLAGLRSAMEIVKQLNRIVSAHKLERVIVRIEWRDILEGANRRFVAAVSFDWFGCKDPAWEGEITEIKS